MDSQAASLLDIYFTCQPIELNLIWIIHFSGHYSS